MYFFDVMKTLLFRRVPAGVAFLHVNWRKNLMRPYTHPCDPTYVTSSLEVVRSYEELLARISET